MMLVSLVFVYCSFSMMPFEDLQIRPRPLGLFTTLPLSCSQRCS